MKKFNNPPSYFSFPSIIIALFLPTFLPAISFYIDPINGNDNSTGTTVEQPYATLWKALNQAFSGDTIYLLPGTYPGKNYIQFKEGEPDKPLVITSYASDPLEFAIIDAQTRPSSDAPGIGFAIARSSWINLENLVFRNCWTDVISIIDASYVTVRNCHFTSGKRAVFPFGADAHHVLVENCYVKHPDEVWQGWSWEALHHGSLAYYNGALLHPRKSGGGHIMRYNTIINLFNGFRTYPDNILQDGNTEVYGNSMTNIRDNDFEPEAWAWNMHYYYNKHLNVHKAYSIDNVQGGNIYIYGNTYTQTKDDWAIEEVSGIFKYKNGPLTYPCYAFNNSYYTESKVLKDGEASNHQLKHFNNAYFFFQGNQRFRLDDWQTGYTFDYDCINQDWPWRIISNDQEENGLNFTNPKFVDGEAGQFELQEDSPCIDAAVPMALPEFEWIQQYQGIAPDIGAYEGTQLIDGPPFRFIPSPEGALYEERPRISRYRVDSNILILYFTAALNESSLSKEKVSVFENGVLIPIDSVAFPNHAFEAYLYTSQHLDPGSVSLLFLEKPTGINGLPFTYWASTISIGRRVLTFPDLSIIPELVTSVIEIPDYKEAKLMITPNPVSDSAIARVTSIFPLSRKFTDRITIYNLQGNELETHYLTSLQEKEAIFELDLSMLPKGIYVAKLRLGREVISTKFVVH